MWDGFLLQSTSKRLRWTMFLSKPLRSSSPIILTASGRRSAFHQNMDAQTDQPQDVCDRWWAASLPMKDFDRVLCAVHKRKTSPSHDPSGTDHTWERIKAFSHVCGIRWTDSIEGCPKVKTSIRKALEFAYRIQIAPHGYWKMNTVRVNKFNTFMAISSQNHSPSDRNEQEATWQTLDLPTN